MLTISGAFTLNTLDRLGGKKPQSVKDVKIKPVVGQELMEKNPLFFFTITSVYTVTNWRAQTVDLWQEYLLNPLRFAYTFWVYFLLMWPNEYMQ